MSLLTAFALSVTGWFCRLFYRLGHLVARYPVVCIAVPIVTCCSLGVFFLYAPHASDLEDMYTPINSRAHADRKRVMELFPDGTGENFNPMSLNDHPLGAALIVQHFNRTNLLTREGLKTILTLTDHIKNISMVLNHSIVVPQNTTNLTTLGLNVTSEGYVTSANYVTLAQYVDTIGPLGDDVKVMTIQRLVTWEDVCARLRGQCQIEGGFLFSKQFQRALQSETVTYPHWDSSSSSSSSSSSAFSWAVMMDVSRTLGNVSRASGRTGRAVVTGACAVRFIFNLRRDTQHYKYLSLEWEKRYLEVLQQDSNSRPTTSLDIAFATSHSVSDELTKATMGDIRYFLLTLALMILYASLVTSGGDCVTSRMTLARAGVLSAVLGMFGALGLVSLAGVPFVHIIGCMPFLVLGIGVDDMFLLMAGWSSTLGNRDLTIPKRLGSTFRTAGLGITITSLTDGLAFAVGGFTSVFQSIRNFCIYTGTAVFLCYLCNLSFFGGCMALHGRRMYSSRHNCTCRKVRSREELKEAGRTCCFTQCCGGSVPVREGQDESVCERAPRFLLPRLVLWAPAKVVILVAFAGFLGVSVWSATGLQQGLLRKNLVLPSSFYYKFIEWEENIFGVTFPVSFVFDQPLDYSNPSTISAVWSILSDARQDPDMDPVPLSCWLIDYLLSPHFLPQPPNSSFSSLSFSSTSSSSSSSSSSLPSKGTFLKNLQEKFLPEHPHYLSDVVIDRDQEVIMASRCHVASADVRESRRQAELMSRMRRVADEAGGRGGEEGGGGGEGAGEAGGAEGTGRVGEAEAAGEAGGRESVRAFAYQPIFVFFEQYAAIVPNTVLTVGVTLAAMLVVSLVLLVHPLMVGLVLLNVVMISTGIFGFMALWGLTLSSITMIHLIMSVGFSVDFSAHVCAAYMTAAAVASTAEEAEAGGTTTTTTSRQTTTTTTSRQTRARYALVHASGPILNGGLSSFVGIVGLVFSESYIFRSFFKIMFLVILFGVLHAVFLTPVLLSLIGPHVSSRDEKGAKEVESRDEVLATERKGCGGDCGGGVSLSTIAFPSSGGQGQTDRGSQHLNEWLGGPVVFNNYSYDVRL